MAFCVPMLAAQEVQYPVQFLDSTSTNPPVFTIRTPSQGGGGGPERFPLGFLDSSEVKLLRSDSAPRSATPDTRSPLRVLFIGNSFTYFNEMPRIFANIAAAGTQRRVVVGLVSVPGGPTVVMWTLTDVQQVIQRLPWDVIVLQLRPLTFPDATLSRYVALFRQAAQRQKARLIVWGQYGMPDRSAADNSAFDRFIATVARQEHVQLAPVSDAWNAVKHADSSAWKKLYWSQTNPHPSPLGSYLLSLVFYKTITGSPLSGVPRTVESIHIAESDAALLQRITF